MELCDQLLEQTKSLHNSIQVVLLRIDRVFYLINERRYVE